MLAGYDVAGQRARAAQRDRAPGDPVGGQHRRRRSARGDRRRGGAPPARGSAAASELPRVELPAEARALPLREFRDHMEREYIRIKLDENDWNISRTATGARASSAPTCTRRCARSACRATTRARGRGPDPRRREPRPARDGGDARAHGGVLGAFGAHGLRDRLAPPMLEVYRTGVLYHLVHALAVLAVALAADRLRRPRLVAGLFAAGIVDLLRHALPARDHGHDLAGRGDAGRRPAADRRLGRRCSSKSLVAA